MGAMLFEVTEEHIKLLRSTYVSWDTCEFGAPAIDSKRPYGNSDVYEDIAKILGIKHAKPDEDDPEFSDEQFEYMEQIHRSTQIALQIFLTTGRMEPGRYIKESEYSDTPWRKL